MEPWSIALLGFLALFVLIGIGWAIAFSMLIVGGVGTWVVLGERAVLATLGQTVSMTAVSYELSVVPMFILMGALITRSGAAKDLYDTCYRFLGARPGGLGMATIAACGGFSAVSGSSIATAATMARVAMPEMRRFGYADSLAAGTVASGGTLGILIPPSVILVVYGIQTGTDIGSLFIAGIVPGLLGILLYLATIWVVTRVEPAVGPPGERFSWRARIVGLKGTGPILALFLLVISGIYFGWFTPTEAAGVGAAGALVIAILSGRLTGRTFLGSLFETARTTANLFFVLIGAIVFSNFMNITGLPRILTDLVTGWDLSPVAVVLLIGLVYIVLGCFMESLSMVLLTVPVFFPLATALGWDPIWFGIFVVIVTELSLITPPVGLNLFVIKSVMRGIPIATIYRGVIPFVLADVVRLILIVALPGLALVLPGMMAR